MHIAFVFHGVGRMELNLARELTARGHQVDFVLLHTVVNFPVPPEIRLFTATNDRQGLTGNGAADALARAVALESRSTPGDWLRMASALSWDPLCLPGPRLVRQARALASYMAERKPDVILPSLSRPKTATLLGCRLLPEHPPVVPTVHNPVRRYRHRRRYRHLAKDAAHFVGVSQGVAKGLAGVLGGSFDNITPIYNPVVTPEIQARMKEPPSHPWLADGGAPVILSAGRLAGQKDFPTLIKAFARLAARRPCRLIIMGEGRMRRRLERMVRGLGLEDRISLPGWVDNPFALMSRASLFVVSSRYEGLSMVLVEALACGCPGVSTDCRFGPPEILRQGELGALAPVGDPRGLAEAMERVLDRPPDARLLRERAADFSVDRAVEAYEKLFSTLV